MNVLILKLGATGDVVRTSTLLHRFTGDVTWITAAKNITVLPDGLNRLRVLSWEDRASALDRPYQLAINLEDTEEVAAFLNTVSADRIFGACFGAGGQLSYTSDSRAWFDMSLISQFGRSRADELKLRNRRTYQELLFEGLGLKFESESYSLPETSESKLKGDVAISPVAGPVWPMKAWAYYDDLITALSSRGLRVNVLPVRPTLLEHLADVRGHRCLVSGDSLPMHLALGSGIKCVSIFNCTSPWEICDYGLQIKLVSPLLEQHFYKRTFDVAATTAVGLDSVLAATFEQLE